jgi:hypothetical protein
MTMLDDDQLRQLLAAPTLGAWRREHGVTGPSPYARHALAVAIVEEAIRDVIRWRLVAIFDDLRIGIRPDLIARRLHRLALEVDPAIAATPTTHRGEAA